eukprot:TRINITY_DN61_c0_g1_i1.p1 TRINITY_DN61_c0_g1~~TRINITY_DN61_c0_g1_i1.p1  ORF type:complete len:312 (+),score=165.00 TRINITY_DN61_c0_g1_i1:132-1067(+)
MSAAPVYTKVFVGNLSFKTKANELAEEFANAGKVVTATIITRGTRSLGYGFIEMEKEEDAHKAVALLNKRNLNGRDINVEVARPRDEALVAERREKRQQEIAQRKQSAPSSDAPRNRSTSRRRRPARRQTGERKEKSETVSSPVEGQESESKPVRGRGSRSRKPRGPRKPRATSEQPPAESGGEAPVKRARKPRGPRKPRDNSTRPLSTTTLFVANLPFALTDEAFSELFRSTNPTKAHVVMNRNGRSKGFGFVEYATEEQQQSALKATTELVSEGRPLAVKIALTPPVIAEKSDSPATETPKADETPKSE